MSKTLIIFYLFITVSVSAKPMPEQAHSIVLPKISNQNPITLVAEQGFWTDYLKQQLIHQFTLETGVTVHVESMSLGKMQQAETAAMQNGNGQYDVLTLEAGWAKEWAANGYTVPIKELITRYEPNTEKQTDNFINNYYPALLDILSYQGQLHSVPYNSYVMGNHYRKDLFENKQESQAFLKQYTYPLSPPQRLDQLLDIAAFFTRKKGDKLAGKILRADFYGVALMSGNRPHINDELSSILWGLGGKWFEPEYENDEIKGFHSQADSDIATSAAKYYINLMQYAYPSNANFAYLEAATALNEGHVAMWPFAYNNLWSVSGQVNEKTPGAELGISTVAGEKPYHGAYSFAVSYDSKNPEAAYWLLKYLSSFDSQLAYANAGGNPCRLDVINYLSTNLPKQSAQYQALQSSLQGDKNWQGLNHLYGHFSSTAMGTIYPELMKAAYKIATQSQPSEIILKQLNKTISIYQNLYGEKAMLAE
ncbi:ABC transporter substrate-binding protein [Psychromonas sp. Urea-02u-13]|uniref:ABC transporter substrate-binding protein n=1 Tax=Psychromonas sp. Urea-02u-13 TaxID=2058326 RepID=UPI000C349DDF|nr:extracellular solute-binding protein [Psychromonas sp. Urea-02u-13]PKG37377.1 sugar ABC transporter substrate-binding protein [Psychromonas sp. Urea-02u-13]